MCPRWWGFGRRFALAAGGGGFGRWWGVWPLAAGRCPSAARTSVVIEAGIGFVPEAIFVSDFRGLHEQLGGESLRQSPAGGGSAAASPGQGWGFGRRFARAGVGIRPPLRQGGGRGGFGRQPCPALASGSPLDSFRAGGARVDAADGGCPSLASGSPLAGGSAAAVVGGWVAASGRGFTLGRFGRVYSR